MYYYLCVYIHKIYSSKTIQKRQIWYQVSLRRDGKLILFSTDKGLLTCA